MILLITIDLYSYIIHFELIQYPKPNKKAKNVARVSVPQATSSVEHARLDLNVSRILELICFPIFHQDAERYHR